MEKLVQENFVFDKTMLSETPENRIMTYKDGASAQISTLILTSTYLATKQMDATNGKVHLRTCLLLA